MHMIYFNTKNTLPLEEGSILKYLGQEYDKDYQNYKHVFQVIGDPVTGNNATITHYTLPTSSAPFITHIKVV